MKNRISQRIGSFLAVILLASFVTSSAQAQSACFEIFKKQEVDALGAVIELEKEVDELWQPILSPPINGMTIEYQVMIMLQPRLEDVHQMYEKIANDLTLLSWQDLKREIDELHEIVRDIKKDRDLLILRETNRDFSVLMENPQSIRPNTYYSVKGIDPYVEKVYFSKEVVEKVFYENASSTYAITIDHILHAIYRGKVGHQEVGITQFSSATDVYKVRVLGVGGNLRVAGFFVGRTYFVVAWSYDGNHGNSDPLVNAVRRARDRMGL